MERQVQDLHNEAYMIKLSRLERERNILGLAETCFSSDVSKLQIFMSAFTDLVVNLDTEIASNSNYTYANNLVRITREINDKNILQQLKNEMNECL